MDLMKVLDQTVREIRREVNLKVLKVPEIEQKVLDATSSESWGPHGSALSEIAQATKKYNECPMIMNVLWTRLKETGSNWRHVYKALAVIEYLVAHGSERALDDILEHTFLITSLSGFEYVEPNGKDVGINVRKKVETILALLNDQEKIKAVRDKAAANRDKYIGLSSTGITFKSSSKSYDTYDSHSSNYGSIGRSREGESFRDSYKVSEEGEKTNQRFANKTGRSKSKVSVGSGQEQAKLQKGVASYNGGGGSMQTEGHSSSKAENVGDDFDDFDPRGSSTSGLAETNKNQVDLCGESLLIDLMDAPALQPADKASANCPTDHEDDLFAGTDFLVASVAKSIVSIPVKASSGTDLFADAHFVSASSVTETTGGSHSQGNTDLFASQPAFPVVNSSQMDLFAAMTPDLPHETKSHEPISTSNFDPFAAVPLSNSGGSDLFGDFTSHADFATTEHSQSSTNKQTGLHSSSTTAAKPTPKDTFQVKSGIWADSLSRGLIDLNITAPKKTSLAELGTVADNSVGTIEEGPFYSAYTERNAGASISSSRMPGNGSSSTFNPEQFRNFI